MQSRLSIRRPLLIATFGPAASLIAVMCRWIYLHQGDPDFPLELANFAVVLLPFEFSILFAFVPDMRTKHRAWKISVIAVGVAFSLLLWKQQHLAMESSKRDQTAAVTAAVEESNKHSDAQIGRVRDDFKTQATKNDERLNTLESHLDSSIGKVKPPPPQFAGLVFSFYVPEEGQFPQLLQSVRLRPDRSSDVEFFVKNISDEVAAERGDIFMEMCLECMYRTEPKGFQKVAESPDSTRHKTFEVINPSLSLEPWIVSIAFPWDPPFSVDISFRYECQTCGRGKHPSQVLKVNVVNIVPD